MSTKPLDTAELGPIKVKEHPRILVLTHLISATELGAKFAEPDDYDMIEWQGRRFKKEKRA